MAESQTMHRQCLEKWAIKGGTILSFVGVVAALIISLAVLYFSYILMQAGHTINGTILTGIGLGGLVYSFIYGTRARKEELIRKDQKSQLG